MIVFEAGDPKPSKIAFSSNNFQSQERVHNGNTDSTIVLVGLNDEGKENLAIIREALMR